MQSRIAQLQSEIKNLNEEENSYQDEVYRVDLKLVELRKAVSDSYKLFFRQISSFALHAVLAIFMDLIFSFSVYKGSKRIQ